MDYCFVHAADLHLDTPYEGVSASSPEVAAALREASLDAFDDLISLTLDREAAFLVLSGDIYDGAVRGVRAQLRFLAGLRRLSEAGVATFVVHGNHDPIGGWPGLREWPPGVRIFGSDEVEVVTVERAGEVVARVHGLSYSRPEVTENLALRFRPEAGPGLSVAVLHANVGGDPGHGPYSPCALADLTGAGFDYWALGHIHKHQVLSEGPTWVVYPGATQGRSLKPSERAAKGACVVHVTGGSVRAVEAVPVDRVRFAALEIEVEQSDDIGGLRARLQAEAEILRRGAVGRGLVVRAMIRGRGGVHADLSCGGGVEGLLRDLRDEYEGERPFLWWESIRDETRPEIHLDTIRARDDFSAALVSRVDGLLAHAEAPKEFVATQLAAGAPRKMLAVAAPLEPDEARSLVEEARALALDLLEEQAETCA